MTQVKGIKLVGRAVQFLKVGLVADIKGCKLVVRAVNLQKLRILTQI